MYDDKPSWEWWYAITGMMTRHFIHHDSRNLYFDNHDMIDDNRNMDEDNHNLYDESRYRMMISGILYDDTP